MSESSDDTIMLHSPEQHGSFSVGSDSYLTSLKQSYRQKYERLCDSCFREVNLEDAQVEILLAKNLRESPESLERGVVDQLGINIVMNLLSEEKENIKKDIAELRRSVNEECQEVNRLQSLLNRLKSMKYINKSSFSSEQASLKIKQKFKLFKTALNDLIEEIFPEKEDGIKCILQALVSDKPGSSDNYPYVKISRKYDSQCIQILISANIIEFHPQLDGYIKLACELL